MNKINYLLLFVGLIFCCNTKNKLESYDIPFKDYHVTVTLENGIPVYQKYFEEGKEFIQIDSIIKDSMFSYVKKNKLLAKGKWKLADNKKIIHTGFTIYFNNDTIHLVEFSDYDAVNDINITKNEKIIGVK